MPGEKIAQFLLTPIFHDIVEEVYLHELYDIESERGTGRFGSTNE